MKNLIIYSGISLVVLANIKYTSSEIDRKFESSQHSKKELVSVKVNKESF